MNRPRRKLHRLVWIVLIVAIPVLIGLSISGRNPIEPMEQLPAFEPEGVGS